MREVFQDGMSPENEESLDLRYNIAFATHCKKLFSESAGETVLLGRRFFYVYSTRR